MKKTLRILASAAVLALLPALGQAQAYPAKPIRIIAPFPPGSGPDANARELAAELTKHLGQTVYVENKPGASSMIGTELGAKAAPDGYTLLIGSTTSLSTVPHLYAKVPYNAEKDFIPISLLGLLNTGLVAHPKVAAGNASELVALVARDPAAVNVATQGIGSYSHLSGLWFNFASGSKLNFVPYSTSNPYLDLLGGQVQLMFDGLPAAAGNIQTGKLKLLAITGEKRHPAFPGTPTFAELGVKDFAPVAWQGLLAPAGTPKAVVDRLAAAMKLVPTNPELVKKWTQYGGELVCNSPAEFAAFVKADNAMWGRIIKQAGVRLE
ncbi:MAG: Bug family tripartite tricarboxylate transporter substrate binding protein [Ramlibacter sp.]